MHSLVSAWFTIRRKQTENNIHRRHNVMINSAFCWEKCSCKLNLILISFHWFSKLPLQSKLLRALHVHYTCAILAYSQPLPHTLGPLYSPARRLLRFRICWAMCKQVPLLLSPWSMIVYKPREKNPAHFSLLVFFCVTHGRLSKRGNTRNLNPT